MPSEKQTGVDVAATPTEDVTAICTDQIIVIDDHAIVCYGYSQLIAQEPDLEIVAIAATQRHGLELLHQLQPNLAIIDLSLGEGSGLDLLKSVANQLPNVRVLVVSAHEERLFAGRVMAAGGSGFISKQEAPEKLIDGIRAVLRGERYFSDTVVRSTRPLSKVGGSKSNSSGIEGLTNRELQVFEKVGCGQSTREIAEALFLSIKTVERHKENIKMKIGVQHATQLVQHATQWVIQRGR